MFAARDGQGRRPAGPGAGEAGIDHAAHEVQGGGVRVDQGGGREAHAVLQGIPAAVLLPDDGRDGLGGAAGRDGDGDARGQRDDRGGAPHADRDGRGGPLRDPRRRPHRRRRRRHPGGRVTRHGGRRRHPEDPDPHEGVRSQAARHERVRDPRHRGSHGVPHRGADPAAHHDREVHRSARPPHRQEVARAVRDPHPPPPDRHPRSDAPDRRRADEARALGRRGRRDQALGSSRWTSIPKSSAHRFAATCCTR